MKPLELAMRYMEVFFSGHDLSELESLFAKDLRFRGPFYAFDSAREYMEALRADPPKDARYEIIRAFEQESSACLFYRFSKPGVSVPMAQLFEVTNGKIDSILLIFDSGAFVNNSDETDSV